MLPPLAEGDRLELKELKPEQKFTQPPPRYSEATLVKALEENGIGRPSTYASIIGVIQAREYVNKIEGRFKPTMLGMMLVEKLLSPAFDDILDVELHARARGGARQDRRGQRRTTRRRSSSFYKKFEKDLKRADKEMLNLKEGVEPDPPVACDKCGKPMVIKAGKFGLFLACSGYPECENTRELETPEAERRGRRSKRRARTAASRWRSSAAASASSSPAPAIPSARRRGRSSRRSRGMTAAKPDQILDEKCPKCELEPGDQAGPLRRVHRVHELSRAASTSSRRRPASSARRTAATSSSASRGAGRCSSAAPTIRTATSCCGTGRSPRSARSAARRSWSRRSPSGTAAS